MSRPRKPAQILELSGAFAKNPNRRREDPEGAGEFNPTPPQHLPPECVRAWRHICDRLPRVAVYSTDEISVEIAARLLAQFWAGGSIDVLKELRQWLMQLGFSPQARTKLIPADNGKAKNRFNKFSEGGNDPAAG